MISAVAVVPLTLFLPPMFMISVSPGNWTELSVSVRDPKFCWATARDHELVEGSKISVFRRLTNGILPSGSRNSLGYNLRLRFADVGRVVRLPSSGS
jgi:hypothetical protein